MSPYWRNGPACNALMPVILASGIARSSQLSSPYHGRRYDLSGKAVYTDSPSRYKSRGAPLRKPSVSFIHESKCECESKTIKMNLC
jgi:hypothetical protein